MLSHQLDPAASSSRFPEFGYRFLADEAHAAGQSMAERTAWKICSSMEWWSAFSKNKRRGQGR